MTANDIISATYQSIKLGHRAEWVDIINYSQPVKRQIWSRVRFEKPRIREERAEIDQVVLVKI